MSTGDYGRAFTRWWWLVVIVTVAGFVVGTRINATADPEYRSAATVLVGLAEGAAPTPADALSASALAVQRTQSYANVARSDAFSEAVVRELRLPMSTGEFADRLTVTAPADSSTISLSVADSDPQQALDIARTSSELLVAKVRRGERGRGEGGSTILEAAISTPAILPTRAAAAPPWRNPAVSMAVGLVLGLAAATVAFRLDPRVRGTSEAAASLGAPPLGRLLTRGVLPGSGSRRYDASLQDVRASLWLRHGGTGPRTVALASIGRTDEVTRALLDLGRLMADGGSSVLVVDADLRNPTLADHAGLVAEPGLADCLGGSHSLAEAVRQDTDAGLSLLTAGTRTVGATDLLLSPRYTEVLQEARSRHDVVLVIAPPVAAGADCLAATQPCDEVLLGVSFGRTTVAALRRSAQKLAVAGVSVSGFIEFRRSVV